MYTVKCDGQWLYNPQLNYHLVSPKLVLADCSAGSFEFTMVKTHPMYDAVHEITSRIYVYRDGIEIWEGRPIKEKDDWYGNRTVTCEGALAYLNDTIQEQAEYHDNSVVTWLTTLINKHNAKVDASRQFRIGTVTVEDNLYRYTNYETTLGAISDKLINRLGGHLRVRKSGSYRYLDYLKDYPYSSTQKIEFGRNLLDFSKNFDLEDIATAIIPLGARLEESPIEALEAYTTVSSVNTDGTWHTKNTIYVQNQNAVNSFGWICKVVHWDDVTEASNLYTKAKKYLTDFQYNDLKLEIKAVDFHMVDSEIEALNLLDQVQVISVPHGLDKLFPITKMDITLNSPANTVLTLGTSGALDETRMTAKSNAANKALLQAIEEIPTEAHLLNAAKEIATDLITSGALGSYVIIHPDEIIVTNNLNYTARTAHVWRWNKNGLGYSSTGYNGTFGLAMTANGEIVADKITSGTMYADRIKGGILTLGGSSNTNGIVKVYDSSGTLISQLDNSGFLVKKGIIQGPDIIVGGNGNANGSFKVYDANNNTISQWDRNGINLYGNDSWDFGFKLTMVNNGATLRAVKATGGGGAPDSPNVNCPALKVEYSNSTYTWKNEFHINGSSFEKRQNGAASPVFQGFFTPQGINHTYNGESFSWSPKADGLRVTKNISTDQNMNVEHNLYVSGTKARVVTTKEYGKRSLYCYEMPSPIFGDVGEGTISDDGKCYVSIDSIFAKTVTLDQYQVFLQKYGDGDIYISERNHGYFVVEGTPGLSFGWELKAKQTDYDQLRLDIRMDSLPLFERTDYGAMAIEHINDLEKGEISV